MTQPEQERREHRRREARRRTHMESAGCRRSRLRGLGSMFLEKAAILPRVLDLGEDGASSCGDGSVRCIVVGLGPGPSGI